MRAQFIVVNTSVLPEIFEKVLEVKKLVADHSEKSFASACKRVGISRSAFYKYRDAMMPFQNLMAGHIITFQLMLKDRTGVLSGILSIFAYNGANILTINQSIPTSGVAPVTITAATENMQTTMEAFMAALKAAEGIIRVHLMAG